MTKKLMLLFLFGFLLLTAFSQQAKKSLLFDFVKEKTKLLKQVGEVYLFQPAVKQMPAIINATVSEKKLLTLQKTVSRNLYTEAPSVLRLVLPLIANTYVKLDLVKEDVNNPAGFSYGDGITENRAASKGIHYRGYINGDSNSIAAFSVFENGEVMTFFSGAKGNFNLGKAGKSNEYILYNSAKMQATSGFTCSTIQLPAIQDNKAALPTMPLQMQAPSLLCKKVRLYWEGDYKLYSNNFSSDLSNTANYLSGLFNQVAVMYLNEGVPIELSELFIWTAPDGYNTSTSSSGLSSFKSRWNSQSNNFKGDLAVLIDGAPTNNGGIAYMLKNAFCNRTFTYGYANIYGYYNELPAYSWDIYVVTHEMGHLMGSEHTQWCGWNTGAGGTCGAIDDCYTTEASGSCSSCAATTITNPNAPQGFQGTIMSYCHLRPDIGINLADGFGPLPQNAIRTTISNANCTVYSNTWTGAFGTAWEDPNNWSCGNIPNAITDVTIPGGLTNYPIINSAAICRKIKHQQGSSVLVNTGSLSVMGKTSW